MPGRTAKTVGLAALFITAAARADLVTNGGFESNGGNGQIGFNTSATDWSVPNPPGSYAFLFAPGTADTTGANGQYGNLGLWGPGNGSNNGLAPSPAGGFFVALDGAFQQGALSQTINGLTPGAQYDVGFYLGFAQQSGFFGATSQQMQVSLGGQTITTPLVTVPSQGFSGWALEDLTFTATSPSEVLSFFAIGSPQVPPFALLDGVTLNAVSAVPEPSSMALLGTGALFGFGWIRRRRKSGQAAERKA